MYDRAFNYEGEKMNIKKFSVCFALVVLTAVTSFAQRGEFIRYQSLNTGLHFKTWRFGDEGGFKSFTEFAFPFSYSVSVSPRLGVEVITSPFLSSLDPVTGDKLSHNNLSDSFVRASYIVGDHRVLLTLGVGIPTGKAKLNNDQLTVAGFAANRPLDNPVTNFGTGLNVNFAVAAAQEIGTWIVGLGVGYSLRQNYDALSSGQEVEVDPGDELNLTFGVDKEFEWGDEKAKFTSDFIYTRYTEDDLNGQPFFEAGDRFLLQAKFLLPLGKIKPLIISLANRWRLDNRSNNAALIDNGNELEFGLTAFSPLGKKHSLKYLLDVKIYSNTVDDTDGALIGGVGLGVILRFSDRVSFDPAFKFSKGRINVGSNNDIDLTGLEATGGLSIRL